MQRIYFIHLSFNFAHNTPQLALGIFYRYKSLQNAIPHLPAARKKAQRLQGEAESALAESEAIKLQARLEDLNVWERELVKESKKGSRTYTYWMASWREGDKTRNVHLGSARKMDSEAARQKARRMKAEALGSADVSARVICCRIIEDLYPFGFEWANYVRGMRIQHLHERK